MRLALIQPGVGRKPGSCYPRSWLMEPLSLAVLAAATPDEVAITFIDDRLEDPALQQGFELAAITVETYTARRAYALADRLRAAGTRVVLGGFHPTLCPDEAAGHADAVILGEADGLWPQVVADARAGRLQPRYQPSAPPDLSRRPAPRRAIYAGRRYMDIALVEASRGCPFACGFCAVSAFHRGQHRYRPPQEVADEITALGSRRVFLVDDNLTADPAAARALLAAIAPLRRQWLTQLSIEAAGDESLVRELARAGCRGVLIGFEALDGEVLSAMNKGPARRGVGYHDGLARLRDHGIPVYGTFVFGYDGVNRDQFERCLEFALRERLFLAAFNHLVPFPGTPLHRQLAEQGRLVHPRWWLEPGVRFGEVVFEPRGMGRAELAATCQEFRQRFYRWSSTLRRWDWSANCRTPGMAALFLMLNRFSGREVAARMGLPLGDGLWD